MLFEKRIENYHSMSNIGNLQNLMGNYRCGCPDGFVQHLYYNQCIDENECNASPCGDSTCINTIGSYKCGCPDGYQFDNNLAICVQVIISRTIQHNYSLTRETNHLEFHNLFPPNEQVSAGCLGSPCAFGCIPNGANSFSCGCPTGYQRIGQVRTIKIVHTHTHMKEKTAVRSH